MPESPVLPAPGDVIGGKYALTRVIGAGGMGVVYEATHLRLRQRVAIKMLQPELATRGDFVARFDREARAAAQLRSPHVARVIDVDALEDGTPYLVMEFLEGRDLSAEVAARGPLPVAEAVDYLLQTCDAMGEAHRQGTVHRDLKPSNLFLASDERGRILKVLDFGISKVAEDISSPSVTTTFSVLGTALYMSPEQVRSAKHVDARSDVWALGVVLYELLAGRSPFMGVSATAVAAAVVADAPAPLGTYRQDVPMALEAVVMVALEKDRDRRFPDAAAFAAAIAPFAQPPAGRSTARASADRKEDAADGSSGAPTVLSATATATATGWTPAASRAPSIRRGLIVGTVAALGGAITIAVLAIEPRGSSSPAPALLATAAGVSATPPAAAAVPPTSREEQEQVPPSEASIVARGASSAAAAKHSAPVEAPRPPLQPVGSVKAGPGAVRVPPAPSSSAKPRAADDSSHRAKPSALPGKKRTTDLPDDPG